MVSVKTGKPFEPIVIQTTILPLIGATLCTNLLKTSFGYRIHFPLATYAPIVSSR